MNDFLVKTEDLPEALPDRPFKYIKIGDPVSCPRCGKIGDYAGVSDKVHWDLPTDVWFNIIEGRWFCRYCMERGKEHMKKNKDAIVKPVVKPDGSPEKNGEKTPEKTPETDRVSQGSGGGEDRQTDNLDQEGAKITLPPDINYPLPCSGCGSPHIDVLRGFKFFRHFCKDCELHTRACLTEEESLKCWNYRDLPTKVEDVYHILNSLYNTRNKIFKQWIEEMGPFGIDLLG